MVFLLNSFARQRRTDLLQNGIQRIRNVERRITCTEVAVPAVDLTRPIEINNE